MPRSISTGPQTPIRPHNNTGETGPQADAANQPSSPAHGPSTAGADNFASTGPSTNLGAGPVETSSTAPFLGGDARPTGGPNALVGTRVLANNWTQPAPVTDFAGLKIRGLDLAGVDDGRMHLHFPLRDGIFAIPTGHADAQTQTQKGSQVNVDIDIQRAADGQPMIAQLKLRFAPEISVLNPASSLQPTEGALGGLWDWVQDVAGDLDLRGITIGADGQFDVDGTVKRPWPLEDQPLREQIPEGTFPKLNMALETIAQGKLVADAGSTKGKPNLGRLLSGLGAVTERGDFSVSLNSKKARLQADAQGVHLKSDESPLKLSINGEVNLDDQGNLGIIVAPSAAPEFVSGAGEVDLAGHMYLRTNGRQAITGMGAWRTEAHLKSVDGFATFGEATRLPFVLRGTDNIAIGKTIIDFANGEFAVKRGAASLRLNADTKNGASIEIEGTPVDIIGGQVHTEAGWKYRHDDNGMNISDGSFTLRLKSDDARIGMGPDSIRVNGAARVIVHGDRLSLDATQPSAESQGKLRFRLAPKGFSLTDTPMWGTVDYDLRADGSLRLKPGDDGVSAFVLPMVEINGKSAELVKASTPAVGPSGSAKLKAQIAKLCDSPLRTGNQTKLLIDGVMSRTERLRMINEAKDSINLQTLIFKEDQTGLETAQALIAAAKRGVKVRVIIDALGNLDKISQIMQGRQLYQTLRDGGVELALYNDPRDSELGTLLQQLSQHPEFGALDDMDALLNDPVKGLQILHSLIETIGVETPDSTALGSAVNAVVTDQPGSDLSVNREDLAAATAGDKAEVQKLLTTLNVATALNNRWHEKHLIVDGQEAITGGMNIADEYLLGGTDAKVIRDDVARSTWRDTDILFRGPAVADAASDFAKNWEEITGEKLPAKAVSVVNQDEHGVEMQVIQHRPRIDGDHHITNFMVENIKALLPGQRLLIANAYFLPTGALLEFKQALIDAAKRGVEIKVVTNSESTTDLPQVNQAAMESYIDLLEAGVQIFERTGERTMHSKAAVFGDNTAAIGSWNMDNRSASLNSEHVSAIYDKDFAKKVADMISKDMAPDVAKPLSADEIRNRIKASGLQGSLTSLFAGLM